MVSGATPPPPLFPWEGDAVSPLAYRLRRSRGPKTSAPTMLLSSPLQIIRTQGHPNPGTAMETDAEANANAEAKTQTETTTPMDVAHRVRRTDASRARDRRLINE